MQPLDFDKLKRVIQTMGYQFFEGPNYNLNLIGVRNTRDVNANTFNDFLCVAYRIGGVPQLLQMACTTEPGSYYRTHPANVNGTAILPLGQHKGLWEIGKHKGLYDALVQSRPVQLLRDNNKDNQLDLNSRLAPAELAGINCHRARDGGTSVQVDNWSAGCQVVADSFDFARLVEIAKVSARLWGNSFTYTLIEDKDCV